MAWRTWLRNPTQAPINISKSGPEHLLCPTISVLMHSGRKHHVISGWLNISKYQYKQQKIVQAFYLELRSREDQKWRIESKK